MDPADHKTAKEQNMLYTGPLPNECPRKGEPKTMMPPAKGRGPQPLSHPWEEQMLWGEEKIARGADKTCSESATSEAGEGEEGASEEEDDDNELV